MSSASIDDQLVVGDDLIPTENNDNNNNNNQESSTTSSTSTSSTPSSPTSSVITSTNELALNNNESSAILTSTVSNTSESSTVVASTESSVVPIKWNIVPTSNNPTPRFDNTLAKYNNYLYLFGGSEGDSETKSNFSHFQRLNLDTMAWQSLPCTSVSSRVLHTASIHNDAMYIFGGGVYENEKTSYFWNSSTKKMFKTIGALLKFDFLTNEWSTLGEHQPRDGHSMVVIGDEIFVLGGSQTIYQKGSIFSVFFNSTEVYNIVTGQWRSINSPQFGRLGSAVAYQTSNGKNFIYYFGGYDQSGRSNNDLWRLNLETETWRLVDSKSNGNGTSPSDRHSHTANVYDDKMYLYGGYNKRGFLRDLYTFDFITEQWEEIVTDGPPKRRRCNSIVIENNGRARLLLYGGTYLSCYYNDIWEFVFPSQVHIPKDRLLFDFCELFDNAQDYFADCTFVVEGRPIHAHRNILAVRNPYFKSMFTNGLKEATEREINVKNEKFSDFQTMLRYIYSGDESLVTLENCIALLHLSDCYMIDRLKSICEAKAVEGIEFDTVVALYKQADFYKLNSLRQICVSFIAKNHKDVLATGTLNEVDSNFLLEIMYCLDSSLKKEKE